MSTRKPATVTDQSLLDAFASDTQGVGIAPSDDREVRVFYMLLQNEAPVDVVHEGFGLLAACLQRVQEWLLGGPGRGAVVLVGVEEPKAFITARELLSATEQ